jgi:hypothetical protein
MTITITRLYNDHGSAERAVRDLEAAGIPHGRPAPDRQFYWRFGRISTAALLLHDP